MRIKREVINFYIIGILGLIAFRMMLDICYVQFISKIYSYIGLTNNLTIGSYCYSWLILLLLSPFIVANYQRKSLSANIITIFSLISFIPTTSLMAFVPMRGNMLILMSMYWVLLLGCNYYFGSIKIKYYRFKNNYLFWIIVLLMCFAVVYISGKFTGFRFHFGLFDVYSLRFEAREFNIPIVFSYLHTAAGTILPLALVYCMYIRKRVFAIILGLVILLNFGIDGSKSVLFMLFLCFLGYWFFKFEKIKLFVWAFVSISVLSLIEKCIIGTHATTALFTYRLLYLPSWIHYWYYDFFSAHELDYFRQGILRWFGATSPYKEAIYYMISDIYGSSLGSQANNGLFTDAYLNLGALGILLFPPVIVGLLRVLDACAKGLSEKLIILPIISVALVLISAGISIALLTGGVLILLLLLYSMPREDTFFEGAINIKS